MEETKALKKKRTVVIFIISLLILNTLYILLLIFGMGEFLPIKNYIMFFTLTVFAYLVYSFGRAEIWKAVIVPHFFALFPMLVIFGPVSTSLVAYMCTVFSYRKNYSIRRRLYTAGQYGISYYIAGAVLQITGTGWLSLIVAMLVFKILNSIFIDMFYDYLRNLWESMKMVLKDTLMELVFFSLTIPVVFVLAKEENSLIDFVAIYTLVFPVIFAKLLSIQHKVNQKMESEKHALSQSLDKLKRVFEVSEMLKSNISVVDLMNRVASIIHNDLGWEYVLVSMITPDNKVERVASAGISAEDFERLKKNPPSFEFIRSLMKDKFKISNSYFIPEEAQVYIPSDEMYIGEYDVKDENSWRERDLLWIPIINKSGEMVALISPDKPKNGVRPTFDDITVLEIFANQVMLALENSSEFEILREKALRDGQTGLYNHTEFYSKLEKMVDGRENFCLIMMDIDDFKIVNDTYGHQMGDKVISYIADVIKSSTRQDDVSARYGGEEFAMVLRGIEKKVAKTIAERIRLSIAMGNSPVKITVSMGIACYPMDAINVSEIVAASDRALYMAKMRGKNQVVVANEK